MCSSDLGDIPPTLDDAKTLKVFFQLIQTLKNENMIEAYHDRSDGGLFTTLTEMAFAGRCGLNIDLTECGSDIKAILFNEELGAVIQVKKGNISSVLTKCNVAINQNAFLIGSINSDQTIQIKHKNKTVFEDTRSNLQSAWTETSFKMQSKIGRAHV